MSETKGDHDTAATANQPSTVPHTEAPPTQLTELMADGAKGATAKTAASAKAGPNLDAQALRAAEQALAEGEQALATARAQLATDRAPTPAKGSRGRELALRLLLAANVIAMLVVAMLPTSAGKSSAPSQPPVEQVHPTGPITATPITAAPRADDRYTQAMLAAADRDYPTAIRLLEQYLVETPRMAPSSQMNVLMALSWYSHRVGNLAAAQDYERRFKALNDSHSLPDDLVAMAQAAAKSGDQESLRRVWARFLLQQRQVPSSLYKHVAEAYLQLGDSYRNQANEAGERERVRQLEETAMRLREQAKGGQEKTK